MEGEVQRLDKYFHDMTYPANHKKVLRYFLFSCFTGVRISDINLITWANVHDDMLIYRPVKTQYNNLDVNVPLLDVDKEYLPEYTSEVETIFDTFAEPMTNRLLKDIADICDIKKRVTYHASRHTFGSLMAETGDILATQKMMGHGDIKTTMGYVHTSTKQLVDAKRSRFDKSSAINEKKGYCADRGSQWSHFQF